MRYTVQDSYVRNESWVKKILKKSSPDSLSELIYKRITDRMTGPWYSDSDNEISTDIFGVFCKNEPGFKEKIEPAVGLLLYKIINNEQPATIQLLDGIFYIISDSHMINCSNLLYRWLKLNFPILTIEEKNEWRGTYRTALVTFARLQNRNDVVELFWYNIWKEAIDYWWPAAFLGLRIQNPKAACLELPTLMKRAHKKSVYMLCGMWADKDSKNQLESALKKGIKTKQNWAIEAIELMKTQLSDDNKKELILNLGL